MFIPVISMENSFYARARRIASFACRSDVLVTVSCAAFTLPITPLIN
jgi:hypothetical protein